MLLSLPLHWNNTSKNYQLLYVKFSKLIFFLISAETFVVFDTVDLFIFKIVSSLGY